MEMMKRSVWYRAFLTVLTGAVVVQAETDVVVVEEVVEETSAEFTLDYYSAYVWRGQVCNSAAVVQPGLYAAMPFGLTLGAWGNMDATKKNEQAGKFNEVDLSAVYSLPLEGIVGVDLGIVDYLYPYNERTENVDGEEVTLDGSEDTTEINATVSLDVPSNPSLMISRDIDECLGYYGSLSFGHTLDLTDLLSMEGGISFGIGDEKYNEYYFGSDNGGWNDVSLSLAPSYMLTEDVSVGATLAYTYLLDGDVREAAQEAFGYKDHFYAGLNMAYSF